MIELGSRQLELLGIVAQHAFRRAFDAAPELVDFPAGPLARLTRLRQITLAQHFAREIQSLAAALAL